MLIISYNNYATICYSICLVQMEESIGMVMGFTIISAALEWLCTKWETIQKDEEERQKRQKDLEDEEEKV